MKTFHQHPFSLRTLTGYGLFGLLGLASPLLSAQTFTGQNFLIEIPASFRAIIKASARQETITIRLENRWSKAIRIQILNQAHQPVYNDYVTKTGYYTRFDVSALPYGTYTIELSNRYARQTQQFLIERSDTRRVVMGADPPRPDSLLANY